MPLHPMPKRWIAGSAASWIAGIAAVTALACGAPPAGESARLPTLVLITLDTLNERHLGFFGYPTATSPALDAWLAASLVFEETQTAAPWTLPSVASVMTGLPYSLHGAGNFRVGDGYDLTAVRSEVPVLAEVLRERGYTTTAIVANPYFDPRRGLGLDRGFDRYYVFDGKDRNGETREALAEFDPSSQAQAVFEGEGFAQHLVDVFERAFLPEHEAGAFYWIHFLDAHNPYVQRDRVLEAAGIAPIDAPDGTLWLDWEQRRAMKVDPSGFDATTRDAMVRAYDGEVAYLDRALGRLFTKLDAVLPGDAWTLLTTDHGEELWEHGRVDHDHSMFQELIGSFVGLRGPGVIPRRDGSLVRHVDIFETLCALAVAECPGHDPRTARFAGRDLLSTAPPREAVAVSENNLTNPMLAAVRVGNRKLVVDLTSGAESLYDLRDDPAESAPHADAADRTRLAAYLSALQALRPAGRDTELTTRGRDPSLEDRLRQLGYVE